MKFGNVVFCGGRKTGETGEEPSDQLLRHPCSREDASRPEEIPKLAQIHSHFMLQKKRYFKVES